MTTSASIGASVEETLAAHVVRTSYENVPPDVVALVKEKILDTLGAIVAGAAAAGSSALHDQLAEWGGRDESTVAVSGVRLPTASVAQLHGSWAHADEFCDNDDRITLKASATVVPIALAFGELMRCDGKALMTSVAIGIDLAARLGLAIRPQPATIGRDDGVFSGAVTAAKILGLDENGVLDAMGIGYSQLATTPMGMASPSLTKRLIPGQVNRAAAWGAALAARGFPTDREILQGPRGYFRRVRGSEPDEEALIGGLGTRYEVVHCPKPYPSGRFCHPPVDAAIALRREHGFSPDQIAEVTVGLASIGMASIGAPAEGPGGSKQRPRGVVDAQTSATYNVAVALRFGTVGLEHFTDSALQDPETLALTARTREVVRPELDGGTDFITPAIVEVTLTDGRVLAARVDHAAGSPQRPMSSDQVLEKFWGCIEHSPRPLDRGRVNEALRIIDGLESVDDVGVLVPLLTAAG